jgi:hypothetical protein
MKNIFVIVFIILVTISLVGCGSSHSSSTNGNINLRIVQSKSGGPTASMVCNMSPSNDQVNIDDGNEYGFGGSIAIRYVLYAYDQDNNEIPINGNNVTWSCSIDGILKETTGREITTGTINTNTKCNYTITATYNGQTATAVTYCYLSNILYYKDVNRCGITFSNGQLVSNSNNYDIYMTMDGNHNIVIVPRNGMVCVDNNRIYKTDLPNESSFSLEPIILTSDIFSRVFVVKCDNGHYAKFKIIIQDETRISIYYDYQ